MGHWAQAGKLSPEHFQSCVHNAIVHGGTAEELLRIVITLFSYERQKVIGRSWDSRYELFSTTVNFYIQRVKTLRNCVTNAKRNMQNDMLWMKKNPWKQSQMNAVPLISH